MEVSLNSLVSKIPNNKSSKPTRHIESYTFEFFIYSSNNLLNLVTKCTSVYCAISRISATPERVHLLGACLVVRSWALNT